MHSGSVDVGIGRGRQMLVVLLSAAVILDGLDVKILAYAAPLILQEWGLAKSAFGLVLAAASVGMAMGTPLGGWAGDRFGRRIVVIVSLLLFGMATALASLTRSPIEMIALRFIGGLGCGAVTPNAYALFSEWLPLKARHRAFALLTIGFPLGGMLGASFMLWFLPLVGWRGTFFAAGVLTIVIMVWAAGWLPESPAFLRATGRYERAQKQWESLVDGPIDVEDRALAQSPDAPRISVLGNIYARTSAGAMLYYFFIQFISYSIASWTPVIYTSVGLRLDDAIRAGLFFNLFAVGATFIVIGPLRRVGSFRLSVPLALTTAILLGLFAYFLDIGMAHQGAVGRWILIAIIASIGAACGALFQIVNVLSAAAYPPEIRATGVGFCSNGGRIGAFLAALSGGLLLSWHGNSAAPLLIILACLACAVVPASFLIDRHLAPTRKAIP